MLVSGAPAPQFQLKDTQGRLQSSSQLYENGPVLLFFFKISCPVCQFTAPFMERLAGSGTVPVIGISQDNAASTKAFNGRFGITFSVLLDDPKSGYAVSTQFGLQTVPSLFLIELGGQISTAFSGFSKADLQALGARSGIDIFKPDEKIPVFRAG